MKVLSNLEFKNSTYILNKFNDFPENPVEGMTIFRENGLYIYSLSQISGNLEWLNILDFTRINTSYKFEQGTENIEWIISHNLNTQDLFVIVYDSEGNKQIESEIQFQSDSEIKLIFSEPISGKALLFGASVISSPSNIYTKEEIDELLKNIEVSGDGSNIILPENGVDGYLLSKNGDDLGWTNPDEIGTKLPEDGLPGQILSLNKDENLTWSNPKAPVKLNVGDLVYTFNDNPPANTFLCDSSILDKNSYPELYSIIGDKFFINDDDSKLMVPMYDVSTQASKLSNSTSDLTLGSESYYSVDLDNRIRIKSIGNKGGLYSTQYPAYYAFNTELSGQYYFHSNTSEPGIIEIEYLDGTKFAPYKYDLHIFTNNVWFTQWDLTGWNEETSTWDILDHHDDGTLSNPPKGVETSITVANYDNTKCYSKFRMSFRNMNGGNLRLALWTLKLYGTKEGEASIYDGFALPPSSTNESGAKACIVHSSHTIDNPSVYSEEELMIGTWVDGKPIYRKVYINVPLSGAVNADSIVHNVSELNIDTLTKLDGIVLLNKAYHPSDRFGSINNNLLQLTLLKETGNIYMYTTNVSWTNCTATIILEYTKN